VGGIRENSHHFTLTGTNSSGIQHWKVACRSIASVQTMRHTLIIGDISIAVPVTIFDNGNHTALVPHAVPFKGTLVFTPGALLCNGRGQRPADWAEVTLADGQLNREGCYGLYRTWDEVVRQNGLRL
jgi:hypothetical protein